jgi:hypothetical protein
MAASRLSASTIALPSRKTYVNPFRKAPFDRALWYAVAFSLDVFNSTVIKHCFGGGSGDGAFCSPGIHKQRKINGGFVHKLTHGASTRRRFELDALAASKHT